MTALLLADPAHSAGVVTARLLLRLLGVVLPIIGRRRQRRPEPRGTAVLVAGGVLIAFGVLGVISLAVQATA